MGTLCKCYKNTYLGVTVGIKKARVFASCSKDLARVKHPSLFCANVLKPFLC